MRRENRKENRKDEEEKERGCSDIDGIGGEAVCVMVWIVKHRFQGQISLA